VGKVEEKYFNNESLCKKDKYGLLHTTKVYRLSGGTETLILIFGAGWM
jgi:hypothetical protein